MLIWQWSEEKCFAESGIPANSLKFWQSVDLATYALT